MAHGQGNLQVYICPLLAVVPLPHPYFSLLLVSPVQHAESQVTIMDGNTRTRNRDEAPANQKASRPLVVFFCTLDDPPPPPPYDIG